MLQGERSKWIQIPRHRPQATHRLICLPPAGGGASLYRNWPARLPDCVEVLAVQLPGREARLAEPPLERMGPLVENIIGALEPCLDMPFTLFGFSMGARVALALTHAMLARPDGHRPAALHVAASPAPVLGVRVPGWDGTDADLAAYLREMGGTPLEVLGTAELLSLVLPILRADLTVVATHHYGERSPVPIPLTAYAGTADTYAGPDRTRPWSQETTTFRGLYTFDAGHFFIKSHEKELTDLVSRGWR